MYVGLNGVPYPVTSYPNTTNPCTLNSQVPRIAVEFDTLHLWEEDDRQRRKLSRDKEIPSHVRSVSTSHTQMVQQRLIVEQRRRAQNRASQRAFRDRKEQHVKNLESELKELGGKYKDLEKSYDSLNSSHNSLKTEMKRLTTENEVLRSTHREGFIDSITPSPGEINEECSALFGESVFNFGNELEIIGTSSPGEIPEDLDKPNEKKRA